MDIFNQLKIKNMINTIKEFILNGLMTLRSLLKLEWMNFKNWEPKRDGREGDATLTHTHTNALHQLIPCKMRL